MGSEALDKARERQRELRAAGQLRVLDPLEKAAANPTSLRAAVNGKCFDCQGGAADPGWRERIGSCDVKSCPLNAVRPYQG